MKIRQWHIALTWAFALVHSDAKANSAQSIGAVADAVDLLDCDNLRLDFVGIMPEIIAPQTFVVPETPFDRETLDRFEKADALDPDGLCQYRDANKALPPPTKDRVVFMGDSITEYWSLGSPDMFDGDIVNRGVSSQNTTQMLVRFRHDVINLRPRVVHILAGVNDAMARSGRLSTQANIMAMVDLAKHYRIRVVLGTLTPGTRFWLAPGVKLTPEIEGHNLWLRKYAAQEGVRLVDYYTPLATSEGAIRSGLSNDGLHPNRNGYALMMPLARAAIAAELKR